MSKRNFWWMCVSWASVLVWMGTIFFLSAQHGDQSADLSGGITEAINEILQNVAPDASLNIESISFFVRKNAHFLAYLVLGLLTFFAFRKSGVGHKKGAILAFIVSILYAVSDEVHQLFVPGRSGQVSDVVLDSVGALTGIGIYFMVVALWKKKKGEVDEQ
ncbi:VanZ like family protein [Bacillus sp. THAF10]|uniref:VanZ family protein n=1 Tax=Bacillus sp. THAF10 TaxID=2587848 RepID=UPI001267C566|nr:VanZ family protein [Bacillus sp. THAF10]QFT90723.1 VanZ like family protein [Bacillus sp. THAF10]